MKRWIFFSGTMVLMGVVLAGSADSQAPKSQDAKSRTVQYSRDILPIFSANCLLCHGPDEKARKAGLRLDMPEVATKPLKSGSIAIVPGKPKESELIARISSKGSERMPPAKSHKPLKDSEKELLRRWIEEGAEYQRHWAFVPPARPDVPTTKIQGWARNGIDHFVLARLEA